MSQLAGRFIEVCWVILIVVWFMAAWFAKRTVERSGTRARWGVWIAAILLVGTRSWWLPFASGVSLWHTTASLAGVAAAVTAAGLVVALWARAVLGRNWSGAIVLKEHHELIDRGPYAFMRHPIYTGVLLMVLGVVTVSGTWAGMILFATLIAGLIVKARREDAYSRNIFPRCIHSTARVSAQGSSPSCCDVTSNDLLSARSIRSADGMSIGTGRRWIRIDSYL